MRVLSRASFLPPFCPFILPGHPAAPSAKVSRCSKEQQPSWRQSGWGAQQDTRDPSEQHWKTPLLQQLVSGQTLPLLDLPGKGADDQGLCLIMQAANSAKLCLTSIVQALWEGSLKSPHVYVLHRWPVQLHRTLVFIFFSKLAHYIYYCSSD